MNSKNQTQSVVDELEELVVEAQFLFNVLDAASSKIRDLEKKLSEIKAHFPFSYFVCKENVTSPIGEDKEQVHMQSTKPYLYHSYQIYQEWYIAWEEDDKSKNFRLCLVSRKKEFTLIDFEGNIVESSSPLIDELVFKKPLIETDLPTRLKFIEHLDWFIIKFREYLRYCRSSIESKQLDIFE